jgi:pyruvate-formate lyase-activating enzyme
MGGISPQVHLTAIGWIAVTVVKPADKEEQAKTLIHFISEFVRPGPTTFAAHQQQYSLQADGGGSAGGND